MVAPHATVAPPGGPPVGEAAPEIGSDSTYRRTWPQRLLIVANVVLAAGLFFGASRLASFEEAVGSIIRIDVPAGVLADLDVPIGADGTVDISPRARLFIKESEIIASLYSGVEELMKLENA